MDKKQCFCLKGKSNGIQFMIYSLESVIKKINKDDRERKYKAEDVRAVLRIEVSLDQSKVVNSYTEETETIEAMKELLERDKIFLEIMKHIIPYGDYYKKETAMELLHMEVKDKVLRRKMLRLMVLIPEKKSLHLAQKTMSCQRDMNKILEEFTRINLSPITLAKRQDVKWLKNLYSYIV